MLDLQRLLPPFNPWWGDTNRSFAELSGFRRPLFDDLKRDIESLPQIISLMGPRRVGKTTLLHQLIQDLIEQGVNPRHIVYYSMDDPALMMNTNEEINSFIEEAMQLTRQSSEPFYFFLDEIQRLDRWELYLKKYYDLKYPVRFVISGSASSPIFKKSRESLLGRVKDYHLLPFSFKEYALYQLRDSSLTAEIQTMSGAATEMLQQVIEPSIAPDAVLIPDVSIELQHRLDELLSVYMHEGGFPEVWSLPTLVSKLDYLFDNQIRKVIDEDLVLAVELRKPELLKRFYLSLLEIPGVEKNLSEISETTGINKQQVEKYLPLLEMTDLLFHVSKFRKGGLSVRMGNVKFYLVDLALRNAVLRISPQELAQDSATLGRYAENLVFLALQKMLGRGLMGIDFFREREEKIDFIAHVGSGRYLPIEVKYRKNIGPKDLKMLHKFVKLYPNSAQPVVVTKSWDQFGYINGVFHWPLSLYLILWS